MSNIKFSSASYADTKPHYNILDGLRGAAALMVVWYHVFEGFAFAEGMNGVEGGGLINVFNHGYMAVDFFFMLSGFVISYAYDDRWNKMSLGDFFKRRLVRLHPMIIMGAIIGLITFLLQGGVKWDGSVTPAMGVVIAFLLTCCFIPAWPGAMHEIRGNGEMFPLNGDDWIMPDVLECAYEVLSQNKVDIYCYDFIEAWEDKQIEKHTWFKAGYYDKDKLKTTVYPSLIRNIYGKRFVPCLCSKILERELYKKFQLSTDNTIKIGEDESVTFPCLYYADNIYISNKCGYFYRQNPSSMTKAKKGYPWTDIPLRVSRYRKLLPMDEYDFKSQINRLIVHELFNVALSYLRTDRPYKETKKEIISNFNSDFYTEAISHCKYKNNIKEQLATFAVRHKKIFMIYLYAKLFR